jgi:hypothetical protein
MFVVGLIGAVVLSSRTDTRTPSVAVSARLTVGVGQTVASGGRLKQLP